MIYYIKLFQMSTEREKFVIFKIITINCIFDNTFRIKIVICYWIIIIIYAYYMDNLFNYNLI